MYVLREIDYDSLLTSIQMTRKHLWTWQQKTDTPRLCPSCALMEVSEGKSDPIESVPDLQQLLAGAGYVPLHT
jgi:hypothetical protein